MMVILWIVVFGVCTAVVGEDDAAGTAAGDLTAKWSVEALLGEPMPLDVPVEVRALGRTETSSVQFVRIRNRVRLHIHERHTETVMVVSGKGTFRLGDAEHQAAPGDVFLVPPGTPHGFLVTGDGPAAAITVFSPGFDGIDRVFVDDSSDQN